MSRRTHRRAMYALRWINAGLLVLAACRALIPGLCATQLAVDDAATPSAAHSCCSTKPAPAPEEPGVRAELPVRAACGLCHLMHGMLDPLVHARVCPPAQLAQVAAISSPRPVLAAVLLARHGRAPPAPG